MIGNKEKTKVVWLCQFSNGFVRGKLKLSIGLFERVIRKIYHKPNNYNIADSAAWITNGIAEFEKFDEIELHIVAPYPYLSPNIQEFEANGIYYHFFHNENKDTIRKYFLKAFHISNYEYKKNRRLISRIIKNIQPEIVHLIGAENPHYSLGVLDVPRNIVTIAQLQTLMSDPDFQNNYPIDVKTYLYRSEIERQIIHQVDYIGTAVVKYKEIIRKQIYPEAVFLNISLAMAERIVKEGCEKEYDFVYFSAHISKAADLAIEAFGLAYQKNPRITLDIVGDFTPGDKQQLDEIIQRYGIDKAVTFEGVFVSHDDVLKQIRKSRYALLPLKIDITSGTIREAMANGIPVLTTDTGEMGTRRLNRKRQNVLLSRVGDHQALADNMLKLLEDDSLADILRDNGYQTSLKRNSNETIMKRYVEAYQACLDNHRNGTPLPSNVLSI